MILSDKVKSYEVEGPQLSHVDGYSRIPYTSKKYPGIKAWSMRDSNENLYMVKMKFVVNQLFQAEEEDS
jgi:hypothetical protein